MGLVKNFAYKSVLNFFSLVLPVIIMPYVYRVLNPESVGLYEYGFSIISYFTSFGLFGFYIYGLQQISKNRNNHETLNQIYNDLFIFGIITNLLALVSYFLYLFIWIEDISLRNIMFILSLNFISNLFYTEWINEAFELYKFISIKTIFVRLLSIGLIFLLINEPSDIYLYCAITILSLFLNNIISFIYTLRYVNISLKGINIRKHFAPLFYIFLLSNSFLLYGNFDKVVLGLNVGAESVAYYSVAQKVISVAYTMLMGLTAVSYPRLSYLINVNYDEYKNTLRSIISHTMFFLIPASLGLLLLSSEFIELFAGIQYINSSNTLAVGSVYIIITAFVSIMNYHVLIVHGKERICTILFILFGIINIAIDLLIGDYLTSFIAFATTAGVELLLFFSMFLYAKFKFKLHNEILNRQNFRYLFFSLLFTPIVLLIKKLDVNKIIILIISIIACTFFYLISMYLIKDSIFVSLVLKVKNKLI